MPDNQDSRTIDAPTRSQTPAIRPLSDLFRRRTREDDGKRSRCTHATGCRTVSTVQIVSP